MSYGVILGQSDPAPDLEDFKLGSISVQAATSVQQLAPDEVPGSGRFGQNISVEILNCEIAVLTIRCKKDCDIYILNSFGGLTTMIRTV
jgi:hypothetical protein